MDEYWQEIKKFNNYSVSTEGRIRNEDRGRIVRTSLTKQGAVKVGLVRAGRQYTRSVKVLVAEAFVKGETEQFNTPIHLDGDQQNNHVSNLVWRPRWFALKYTRQFESIGEFTGLGPLTDRNTGIMYSDIVEAGITNGLLFYDVQLSLITKNPVWPTWHMFDWVKV